MVTETLRVPFHLCDPARIMFFGAFFEIYHMFLEENLPQLGVDWDTWFMGTTGAPVRGANVQYDHPLKFGTSYTATLGIKKIGSSSVTFRFEVGDGKKCHAFTEVTHCFVDFNKRTKVDVPKEIAQSFSKHLID
jgi:acyl-CoA thioesterase FadM